MAEKGHLRKFLALKRRRRTLVAVLQNMTGSRSVYLMLLALFEMCLAVYGETITGID